MSEWRQDRTTGRWVIVAPGRGLRPHRPDPSAGQAAALARYDPACPFCPGNEAQLPCLIDEEVSEEAPGWHARAVPNKYPLLTPREPLPANLLASGYGLHEVLVETPRHDADLDDLSGAELAATLALWQRRHAHALSQPGIAAACLFRNRGSAAGASQAHAHSQIIALPQVPPLMADAAHWARAEQARTGACATCAELEREEADGARVVEAGTHFLTLVPFAARSPFEQWIAPRRHAPLFTLAGRRELQALAGHLGRAIRRLHGAARPVAYTIGLEQGLACAASDPALHWSLRIVPELTTPGGFERSSGLCVNPASPEQDAARLRDIAA